MLTDPIADMLTRLRNSIRVNHDMVRIPFSKLKVAILNILQKEGYLKSVDVLPDERGGQIQVALRYTSSKEPIVRYLNRISRPGRRVYVRHEDIKPVFGGMGLAVFSTSKGLMTDKQAKEVKLGGELICTVW